MGQNLMREMFPSLVFLVGVALGSTMALVIPGLIENAFFRLAFVLIVLCIPASRALVRWKASRVREQGVICGGAFYARGEACGLEPRYQCCSCYRPICEIHAAIRQDEQRIYCLDCFAPDIPAGVRSAQ